MPTVGSGGSCGNAFTGCNATALAQICKFYAYPTSGLGDHCNSLSPTNCVDYSLANYNYAAMPSNVTSANSEVATLMYDLGVAVDMNWSGTNSTSFFSSQVLKRHYAYSPKMYGTATFFFPSTADLIAGIKKELDSGRPVYAKGGGHFYLIDGYNASDEFHMNFGWSGTYDGYYPINSVSNPAGTFTPSNFIFQIEPMSGDLETAVDTIFIGAAGTSSEGIEFTSLLDWTMSSADSWITPNLMSGTKGYFTSSDGSVFAAEVNNGMERIAYIEIQNANDTDTIVVVQAESTMSISPNNLNFAYPGGTSSVAISHDSWATWNVSASEPWITISPSAGTGTGSFDVTAGDNSTNPARSAFVIVTGGAFTDTIFVTQDADPTISVGELGMNVVNIYPNPTRSKLTIEGIQIQSEVIVLDILGNRLQMDTNWLNGNCELDLALYPKGIYVVLVGNERYRVAKN